MGTVKERLNEKEYGRTTWINNDTALNADNMNNIEDGIEGLKNTLLDYQSEGAGSQVLNSEIVNGSVVKNDASAHASTAAGIGTIAIKEAEFVVGKYNEKDTDDGSLFVVGSGTNDANRENAFQVFAGKTIINNGLEINCDVEDGQKALQVNGNIELTGNATIGSTTITSAKVQTTDVQAEKLEVKTLKLDETDGSITSPNANIGKLETDDLTVTNSATIKDATIVNSLTVNSDDENATPIISATTEGVVVNKPITFEDDINISSDKAINFGEGSTNIGNTSITTESVEVTKSFVATSTGDSNGDISTIKVEKTDDGKSKVILSGNVEVPTISGNSSDNAPVDKASFDAVKDTVDKFFSGENQVDGVVDTLVEVQTLLEEYDDTHNEIDISKANKFLSINNITIVDNDDNNKVYTAYITDINRDSLLVMDVNNGIDIDEDSFVIGMPYSGFDTQTHSLSKDDIESIGIPIGDTNDNKYRLIFPNCLSGIKISSNGGEYDLKDLWLSGDIDYVEHTMPIADYNTSPFIMNAYFLCDLESAYKELDSIKANKFEGKDLSDAFTELYGKANKFTTGEGESAIDWDLETVYNKTLEIDDTIEETNEKVNELSNKVDECVSSVDNKANKIGSNEYIDISKDVYDDYIIKTTLDSDDRKLSVMFNAAVPEDFIYSDIRIDIKLDDTSCGINDPIANTNSYPYVFPDCIKSTETNLLDLWKKGAEVTIKMPKYVSQVDVDGDIVSYGTYSAEFVGRDLSDVYDELNGKLLGVREPSITKGFYIWDIDIDKKAFVLSTTPRYNEDGSENEERTWTEEDSSLLSRWLNTDVYFDGRRVVYDKETNPEGIGSQYVSYDIGNFFSLYSKIKLNSEMKIDVEEHTEHINRGEILLDKLPTSAEKGFDSQSAFLEKLARDKDFIIYAPLSPDAGSIELYHNQFQQGYGTAVGNGAASMCGESASLGPYSFTAGRGNTAGYGAAAFGFQSIAFADHSFVQGTNCNVEVNAKNGSAFGHGSITSGLAAFSTGHVAKAKGNYSFAQGNGTKADYANQAVFGKYNEPGNYAIIVGGGSASSLNNIATIDWSGNAVFDGSGTFGGSVNVTSKLTSGSISTSGTLAANRIQHGLSTTASGTNSFAGGSSSTSSAGESLAFGYNCLSAANKSVSFGHVTTSLGHSSLSMGQFTIAGGVGQLVIGKHNIPDVKKDSSGRILDGNNNPVNDYRKAAPGDTYKFIIGSGKNEDIFKTNSDGTATGEIATQYRKNIHTVDNDGNAWYAGNVTIGADKKELATKEYVDSIASGGGSGASITVDDALSTTSINPVKNSAITVEINKLNDSVSSTLSEITKVDNKVTATNNEITSINNSIDSISTDVVDLFGETADLDDRIDEVSLELSAVPVKRVEDDTIINSGTLGSGLVVEANNAFAQGSTFIDPEDGTIYTSKITSSGVDSHIEGQGTQAGARGTHAEGFNTKAMASRSHAEGGNTATYSEYSHTEGIGTVTGVEGESIEGHPNYISENGLRARAAHAEGDHTLAKARAAHTEGGYTVATQKYQHVQGRYNYLDKNGLAGSYAHIVGGGTSEEDRRNIYTLDWNGNANFAGGASFDGDIGTTTGVSANWMEANRVEIFTGLDFKGSQLDSLVEFEITYEKEDGTTGTKYVKVLGEVTNA